MQYRFEKLGPGREVTFEIEVIESQKGKFPGRCRRILSRQMCQISLED
jgi:hypothetical protein